MLIRWKSCLSVLVSLLVWLNAVLASFCCGKLLLVVCRVSLALSVSEWRRLPVLRLFSCTLLYNLLIILWLELFSSAGSEADCSSFPLFLVFYSDCILIISPSSGSDINHLGWCGLVKCWQCVIIFCVRLQPSVLSLHLFTRFKTTFQHGAELWPSSCPFECNSSCLVCCVFVHSDLFSYSVFPVLLFPLCPSTHPCDEAFVITLCSAQTCDAEQVLQLGVYV